MRTANTKHQPSQWSRGTNEQSRRKWYKDFRDLLGGRPGSPPASDRHPSDRTGGAQPVNSPLSEAPGPVSCSALWVKGSFPPQPSAFELGESPLDSLTSRPRGGRVREVGQRLVLPAPNEIVLVECPGIVIEGRVMVAATQDGISEITDCPSILQWDDMGRGRVALQQMVLGKGSVAGRGRVTVGQTPLHPIARLGPYQGVRGRTQGHSEGDSS